MITRKQKNSTRHFAAISERRDKVLPRVPSFPKGNKLFVGDLHVNLDETNADMFQFTQIWNWK